MLIIFAFILLLFHLADTLLSPDHAYYIQTDQGESRFFQFSSGPGGQFRRETRLPNGTVVGTYSWMDGMGRTRLYMYMADRAGYRVLESEIVDDDNTISDDVREDDHGNKHGKRKSQLINNSSFLRGKRKVLVKRVKTGHGTTYNPCQEKIKKCGLTAEVIPYQAEYLISTQNSGNRGERRLLGEKDLVTIRLPENKRIPAVMGNYVSEQITSKNYDPESLPSSVLLKKVLVTKDLDKASPSKRQVRKKKTSSKSYGRLRRKQMKKKRRRKKQILHHQV